mmetsp:Transcript_37241/g.93518  ORF Transcript_37241/g.93518 Transcript_37241/m.93518 type:complete len:237 (-) Transcript_37241:1637-2347(-)
MLRMWAEHLAAIASIKYFDTEDGTMMLLVYGETDEDGHPYSLMVPREGVLSEEERIEVTRRTVEACSKRLGSDQRAGGGGGREQQGSGGRENGDPAEDMQVDGDSRPSGSRSGADVGDQEGHGDGASRPSGSSSGADDGEQAGSGRQQERPQGQENALVRYRRSHEYHVLQKQLSSVQDKALELQEENDNLKDANRALRGENQRLQDEITSLTVVPDSEEEDGGRAAKRPAGAGRG